ncbi:MAG: hypothetical protein ACPGOY_01740 [Rhodospirillaceae bacterium]
MSIQPKSPPYDFVGINIGERQEDGLFVDADRRVVFWPAAVGPGYVLDPVTLEDFLNGLQRWYYILLVSSLCLIVGCFYFVDDLEKGFGWLELEPTIQEIGEAFIPVVCLLGPISMAWWVWKREIRPRYNAFALARSVKTLNVSRPTVLTLKASIFHMRWAIFLSWALFFSVAVALFITAIWFTEDLSTQIHMVLGAGGVFWVLYLSIHQERTGVGLDQIWFLAEAEAEASAPRYFPAAGEKTQGPIKRAIQWIKTGWREYTLYPMLICLGAYGVGMALEFFGISLVPTR